MRATLGAVLAVVGILIAIFMSFNVAENLDASKIMVVQSPIAGKLTWHTTPGIKAQFFGKVTKYDKRESYAFEIPVRFNDGGHGKMIGSIQYEMPIDNEHLTQLHVRFGSQKAIEMQLIQTIVNKSIYMTGPLMSSKESFAEKRNYLLSYVEDQIQNGVYKTLQKDVKTTDPLTGSEKTITVVEIAKDSSGQFLRQDHAVLQEFGIRTFNFAISSLPYDDAVEKQIQQQQKIAMDVQTAIASAKQAEQNAITVAKEGEANAAKAKWEQEVIKAQKVTEAEQQKEVAKLEKEAAEFEKQKLILQGEGEAAKKRAIMSADGALDKKLQAWIQVNGTYAEALKGNQLVPTIIMGSDANKGGNGATALVDLLMAKTAKDLTLDMSVPKGGN
ncbi:MAG: SPFH domain-containing protein [Candidatus Nanoarchaeia archaeon]|jgi:regulator of protease activity HflC (stomatin/prohibitin superfamily)|nr:SPFH domain-containing protein [Candidatus Nanoarchaeia archaeon]